MVVTVIKEEVQIKKDGMKAIGIGFYYMYLQSKSKLHDGSHNKFYP